jgi:hypothetical protein
MEIFITVGIVGIIVLFCVLLWKFLTHPATGRIQYHYHDYHDHDKYPYQDGKNIPPF